MAILQTGTVLQRALNVNAVRLNLQATTKKAVIRELLAIADEVYNLKDRAACEKVVMAREKSLSTGMQNGIAMPHGKTDTVDRLIAVVGLQPDGIDFNCFDEQPARIFVMTLSPASKAGPHIQFLAEISSLLRDEEARELLLQSATPAEAYATLTNRKQNLAYAK